MYLAFKVARTMRCGMGLLSKDGESHDGRLFFSLGR